MRLFLLMVIVTAVEVVLISKVGAMIGFPLTLLIIIGTALLGSRLLSKQWRFVMQKLQSLEGNPSNALLEALVLLISGVFLVTPGFLTDIIGFLGLIPTTRQRFVTFLQQRGTGWIKKGHFSAHSAGATYHHEQQTDNSARRARDARVIEGEFERKDDA